VLRKRKWLILPVAALLGIQFFRPERTNYPIDTSLSFETQNDQTPEQVRLLLSRACLNCHSNQTQWPWYSEIAPLSWLIADDVKRGRRELNFSVWKENSREKKAHLLEEASELVSEKDMPPWSYRLLHPEARLSESEIKTLSNWISGERQQLLSAGPTD